LVSICEALDSDKAAIAEQAYRLNLAPDRTVIATNAAPGLFYGVQTLLQLITPQADGSLRLPEGQIVDRPDLRRRIYWDDAHHLDRPETRRNAIAQAAFDTPSRCSSLSILLRSRRRVKHFQDGQPGAVRKRTDESEVSRIRAHRHAWLGKTIGEPGSLAYLRDALARRSSPRACENWLAPFRRKNERLSPFDPVTAATRLCKSVQNIHPKHF
jgi:glycosyl hydrolase family 20